MTDPRFHSAARLGLQSVAVISIGVVLAWLANFLSPRGLELTRDYFPPAASPAIGSVAATSASPSPVPAHEFSTITTEGLVEMLRKHGLATSMLLLIDARNDAHFRSGHLQGALQFDHFRPQNHLSAVIPAGLAAEKIVIYCMSKSCDDALYSARMLRDFGIPAERFVIYTGGIQAWKDAGLPLTPSAP